MKKALLTIFIVLLVSTAAFATYGIDFAGSFVANSVMAKNGFELNTSLKPYVSEDNYKIQLKFDWSANEGFTQIPKFQRTDLFTIASGIFGFIDNAHLTVGSSTIGLDRDSSDVPYFYAKGMIGRAAGYKFEVEDLTFTRDSAGYVSIPAKLEGQVYFNEDFLISLATSTTFEYVIGETAGDAGFLFTPGVAFYLPIQINKHDFTISYTFGTAMAKNYKGINLPFFKLLQGSCSVETYIGPVDAKHELTVGTSKNGYLFATLNADYEWKTENSDLALSAELPFKLVDGALDLERNEKYDYMTADSVALSYDFEKGYFSFGGELEINSLGTAKTLNLTIVDMLANSDKLGGDATAFISASAYVGFDTKPFDVKFIFTPTSWIPFDAKLAVEFNVNIEDYLSAQK